MDTFYIAKLYNDSLFIYFEVIFSLERKIEMRDQLGIMRNHCNICGPSECSTFLKSEQTPFCGYCGCAPSKHEKEIANLVCESSTTDPVTESTTSNICLEQATAESNLNSLEGPEKKTVIFDLPHFSPCVKEALEKGNLKERGLWSNFIMQCAMFYSRYDNINTKSAYNHIGEKLFERYPTIESAGSRPWSCFTKCLSQRIRTDRLRRKKLKGGIETKGFLTLTSKVTPEKEKKETKKIFFRSEVEISRTMEDMAISEIRDKLNMEMEKKNPDKGLIKTYMRETFKERTKILRENRSLFSEYKCIQDSEYILYEFSLLIGRQNLLAAKERMKNLFISLESLITNESDKVSNVPDLNKWVFFEKKVNSYGRKEFKEILKITEDESKFRNVFRNPVLEPYPCVWVLIKDGDVTDAFIAFHEGVVTSHSSDVLYLLTLVMAVYYCWELEYPAMYLQAMGALGTYVLEHKYYRLNKKNERPVK